MAADPNHSPFSQSDSAEHLYVILLAGGGGERFWPRSRPNLPKQFLDLDGTGSLLQKTYQRAKRLTHFERVYVSTRSEYAATVLEHLPELPASNLILEPVGRDTAPGLGLAALVLARLDPDAIMIVLPSDHAIFDQETFTNVIRSAAVVAAKQSALITIGMKPSRPETGFGYIELGENTAPSSNPPVHRVRRFVEKPDIITAQGYLQSGRYLWNSGMFAWQAAVLLEEIGRYLPALGTVLSELATYAQPADLAAALPMLFPQAPRISIDYGVLEKSERVLVMPAAFGWDDVGTWAALDRLRSADAEGNSIRGPAVLLQSRNVLVEGNSRIVAAVGLSDVIIVDSDDALLVCHKDYAQAVREAAQQAEALPEPDRPLFPDPADAKVVDKPWGREVWWAVTDGYAGKIIEVKAGHCLSLQYHRQKLETMYFLRGRGRLLVGEQWQSVMPGSVITLLPGTIHQLEAVTNLTLIEVSTPELDDVVRLRDRYGRD